MRTTRARLPSSIFSHFTRSISLCTLGIIRRSVEDIRIRVQDALKVMNVQAMETRLRELENDAAQGDLWESNPQKAQELMKQVGGCCLSEGCGGCVARAVRAQER